MSFGVLYDMAPASYPLSNVLIGPLQWDLTLGTTGFDVVGSWGRLRVEVPEAS